MNTITWNVSVSSLLGLLMLTMSLNYEATDAAEAGYVGENCLPSGKCISKKTLVCERNSTCKIKRNKDCTNARQHCKSGLKCLISCPCCSAPRYACQKGTELYESCPFSLLLVFAALCAAVLVTGAVFYVVLEKLGS